MRMLVIEDNENYQLVIKRYLTGLADEIDVVRTWEEAEPYLEKNPHIVWIDLIVPGYNADTAIVKVAEVRTRSREAIILVVSGVHDAEIPARVLLAGADIFVNKIDATSHNQIISMLILALMRAADRGVDTTKFLERARQFLKEQVNPANAAIKP